VERAAIAVWVWNVGDARHQRRESLELDRLGCGQRERAHRPPVERAHKSQHPRTSRAIPGQLEGCFDAFCARIREKNPGGPLDGHQAIQFFCQLDLQGVVEIGARHMDKPGRLLLDSPHHGGVAVSGCTDGDTRGAVEKAMAVEVPHFCTLATVYDKGIRTAVRGGQVLSIPLDPRLAPGTGQVQSSYHRSSPP